MNKLVTHEYTGIPYSHKHEPVIKVWIHLRNKMPMEKCHQSVGMTDGYSMILQISVTKQY